MGSGRIGNNFVTLFQIGNQETVHFNVAAMLFLAYWKLEFQLTAFHDFYCIISGFSGLVNHVIMLVIPVWRRYTPKTRLSSHRLYSCGAGRTTTDAKVFLFFLVKRER